MAWWLTKLAFLACLFSQATSAQVLVLGSRGVPSSTSSGLSDGDTVNVSITGAGTKSPVAPSFFFYPAQSGTTVGTNYSDNDSLPMVAGSSTWVLAGTNAEASATSQIVNTNLRPGTSADRQFYQEYLSDAIGTSGWAMGLEFSLSPALSDGDDLLVIHISRQRYNEASGLTGQTVDYNNKDFIVYSNARGGGEYYASGETDGDGSGGSNVGMTQRTGGNATAPFAPDDNVQYSGLGLWDSAVQALWLTTVYESTAGIQGGNGFSRKIVTNWSTGVRATAWDGTTSVATWESGNDWNFFRVLEYFRFADKDDWCELVYADITWQRIVIGEFSTWDAAEPNEVQYPLSWSSDSLSFRFRRGALQTGVALYAYAIDSTGAVVNNTGISIGMANFLIPSLFGRRRRRRRTTIKVAA